jgi:hypothetical protein
MEDGLEVYQHPRDPKHPLVCCDEGTKQHIKETRLLIPAAPGQVAKEDYEYERNGTSNLFMVFAPLESWRQVKVTDQRPRVDWAYCMRDLVDRYFPEAEQITLVMDNLNTHQLASLYEAFPPAEARRIAEKLDIHYTPPPGSWLDMAEIELRVLSRQCLDRRIPDQATLKLVVAAWQTTRNDAAASVNWRFTTAAARIKLKRLYPSI